MSSSGFLFVLTPGTSVASRKSFQVATPFFQRFSSVVDPIRGRCMKVFFSICVLLCVGA